MKKFFITAWMTITLLCTWDLDFRGPLSAHTYAIYTHHQEYQPR